MAGKGSRRRRRQISRAEENIKWALAFGHITYKTFIKKLKEIRERTGKPK